MCIFVTEEFQLSICESTHDLHFRFIQIKYFARIIPGEINVIKHVLMAEAQFRKLFTGLLTQPQLIVSHSVYIKGGYKSGLRPRLGHLRGPPGLDTAFLW